MVSSSCLISFLICSCWIISSTLAGSSCSVSSTFSSSLITGSTSSILGCSSSTGASATGSVICSANSSFKFSTFSLTWLTTSEAFSIKSPTICDAFETCSCTGACSSVWICSSSVLISSWIGTWFSIWSFSSLTGEASSTGEAICSSIFSSTWCTASVAFSIKFPTSWAAFSMRFFSSCLVSSWTWASSVLISSTTSAGSSSVLISSATLACSSSVLISSSTLAGSSWTVSSTGAAIWCSNSSFKCSTFSCTCWATSVAFSIKSPTSCEAFVMMLSSWTGASSSFCISLCTGATSSVSILFSCLISISPFSSTNSSCFSVSTGTSFEFSLFIFSIALLNFSSICCSIFFAFSMISSTRFPFSSSFKFNSGTCSRVVEIWDSLILSLFKLFDSLRTEVFFSGNSTSFTCTKSTRTSPAFLPCSIFKLSSVCWTISSEFIFDI